MTNKTNILLVRHGQTEWNQQHRIQGNQDSALTTLGRKQALKTRQSLEHIKLQQAYVSPLKRARDTAEIILKGGPLEACVLNDLREIALGPWEGKTRQETILTHPVEHDNFWYNPDAFKLPGAETFQQLQHRMVTSLEFIFAQSINENILVVSHWIAIKVALAFYKKIPVSELTSIPDPQNGSFICLTKIDDRVSIIEQSEIL